MPQREGEYAPFPSWIAQRLIQALRERGIENLYSHQRKALDLVRLGKHPVVVTPTASGKTLCYNLPVLSSILDEPENRALYLFPTKALAQDQLHELQTLIQDMDAPIAAFTYDGDTPADARRAIRSQGKIVITSPDMLHTGIMPHHTKLIKFCQNRKYVVIDEIHT